MGEVGELVERALDVTLDPNTPFPLFVRTITNFYRTLSRNTRKTRKNLEKNVGNQTGAKYLGIKSKRCSKEDVDQSSDMTCTDCAIKKPKKTWTYIPDINPSVSSLEKFLRENEVGGEVKDGSSVQVSHCH